MAVKDISTGSFQHQVGKGRVRRIISGCISMEVLSPGPSTEILERHQHMQALLNCPVEWSWDAGCPRILWAWW